MLELRCLILFGLISYGYSDPTGKLNFDPF